jgi:c-di-GMP-binding flagellar brake protein YcgR
MREFIRHPADIPIECQVARQRHAQRERLKNISQGGLCFESPSALERGCLIRITIPVREPPFETTGTIVWCRLSDGHYDVGVQFADASTEFSVRMVEQICYIQRYRKEIRENEGRELSDAEAALEWVGKYAKDFPA